MFCVAFVERKFTYVHVSTVLIMILDIGDQGSCQKHRSTTSNMPFVSELVETYIHTYIHTYMNY